MRSDLAVKWLSLISIKSEQVSKICSMVLVHKQGKKLNKAEEGDVPQISVHSHGVSR